MKQNQKSPINIHSVTKRIRLLLGICFYPILFATLLLNTAGSIPQKLSPDDSGASYYAKSPTGHSNNLPELFIEEESSEEDESSHGNSSSIAINKSVCSFYELNYSSLVNNRFSHLLSAMLQKAESPYFILYHSWKSELV